MMFPKSGLEELTLALRNRNPWLLLGWFDILQRYKRSILGPLWLTLSTSILVAVLGVLWSTLFKMDVKDYMPYFAIGHVIWGFIVMQINEACSGFTQFEHIIKQTRLPLATYSLRLLTRNIIILAHNFIVIIVVLLLFNTGCSANVLLFIPGIIILMASLLGLSIILSILCARYRDAQPIVQNITTIAFFITPIMWKPILLGETRQWISLFNPITHFLHVIREPLLNHQTEYKSWIAVVLFALIVNIVAIFLLNKYRQRVAYWL